MAQATTDTTLPPHILMADGEAVPTLRAAYSSRTAALMAQFSQLAYVPFVDGRTGPAETARAVKADGPNVLADCLSSGAFRLIKIFNRNDTQAFLAVRDDQFAVLAFRGTANLEDWKLDLDSRRVPMPGFGGILVHRGFLEAFNDTGEEIVAAVNADVPDTLALYITGHSLGGGIAQIASAVLARDNLAACYTFGSPRAATQAFDLFVKCPHYRLVNDWDIVPGVPFPMPWGFRHTGDPRLLKGRAPIETLRRDRTILARIYMNLLALVVLPFKHSFSVIDDHMIWNYASKLAFITANRARPGEKQPPGIVRG